MKKSIQLLFGLTALSLVSLANPVPKKGKETIYKVDTQQSKLVWTAKKLTGQHTGTAPISAGSLLLENGKLKGGSFDVDLKALTVTDLTDESYNTKLVSHLKGDDFFAVDKHPVAKLVISSATPTTEGNYDVAGKLTIKGITNDIQFPAQVRTDNGKLTASANITVDRTKYDIKFRSKNFFENLGDKAIHDDFTLDVKLIAASSGTVAIR